ncbi:SDR family oxidoreductase [Zestomonas carbonaria]|uniref:Putative oxidoreductase n=1 Tax=Zestomonas carbonaria TaxID=2762745 RepID=A0A7U7I982_9GAMM|nr:SDR family oxidoreductase [Pseudomonas carbonaria]CAD5107466.1 putative oxidoreductase [Pseudomonas carbonaria]
MSKVILVTGASSGLGLAIAQHLARRGHRVFGTSRSPGGDMGSVRMLALDVTDDVSVARAVGEVIATAGRLDVLINNAGVGVCGAVEDTSLDEVRWQMETNFFGPVRTIAAVLPHMRAQGGGRIITVSSLAGLIGMPFQAFYSASKFAVEGLNEGLRLELSGSGIDATTINPGDFKTGFTAARVFARRALNGSHAMQLRRTVDIYERDERNGADPQLVAKLAARLVERRRVGVRYSVGRFEQRLVALVRRFIPAMLFERLMRSVYAIR